MKPDWDKLAKEYDGSETVLIADVDCTEVKIWSGVVQCGAVRCSAAK